MPNFAEVEHHIWIAAPLPTVRRSQVRKELTAALLEDKYDLEQQGYRPLPAAV